MNKTSTRVLLMFAALALFIVPGVAFAVAGFIDVDEDNVFVADIQWMKDNDITKGCNPPTNNKFCPKNTVTREQMSAFMHRLAIEKVVDAATAVDADHATNADKLGGKSPSAFLTKSIYDTNDDGVVDSAEIKIRYSANGPFQVDIADGEADGGANLVVCVTDPVTFDGTTTVVASGGLNLDPIGTEGSSIYGFAMYSTNGGTTFTILNGVGLEDDPQGDTGDAAVPINAVAELDPGTYEFAILPQGADHLTGNDYSGYCELTVTAYVGLGTSIDAETSSAELSSDRSEE